MQEPGCIIPQVSSTFCAENLTINHNFEQCSTKEQAERERLARLFSGGKPASEMAIEDRGPY